MQHVAISVLFCIAWVYS